MESKAARAASAQRPPRIMRNFFDPLTVLLVGRLGLDDHNGTRVLEVEGQRFVVGMYGDSGWTRNLTARGLGALRLGRGRREFRAVELTGAEKLPAFRAYLRRWWSLVGPMTGLASRDVPDDELQTVAAGHPVFRLG